MRLSVTSYARGGLIFRPREARYAWWTEIERALLCGSQLPYLRNLGSKCRKNRKRVELSTPIWAGTAGNCRVESLKPTSAVAVSPIVRCCGVSLRSHRQNGCVSICPWRRPRFVISRGERHTPLIVGRVPPLTCLVTGRSAPLLQWLYFYTRTGSERRFNATRGRAHKVG